MTFWRASKKNEIFPSLVVLFKTAYQLSVFVLFCFLWVFLLVVVFVLFCLFVSLGPPPRHMEVPKLEVKLEL